jgi:TIR domain
MDFFIAHHGEDTEAARKLKAALESLNANVFLDAADLKPGDDWMTKLPAALKESQVVVVLVSQTSTASPFLQDEIVRAIDHYAAARTSRSIVPVVLTGASIENIPYGLRAFQALGHRGESTEEIAVLLMDQLVSLKSRSPAALMASSTQILDTIYRAAEQHLAEIGGGGPPVVYRSHFNVEREDLVERGYGFERKRISGAELETKLSAADRAHLQVLERSMQAHYAIWEARYPQRSADPNAKAVIRAAILAMADDLKEVLRYIETCGFDLDDHYRNFRSAIRTLEGAH